MRLIEQARSTIHITTYILGRDEGSQALIDCLTRRAAEGVSVRLLLDDVGSWRVRRRFLAPLIEAGDQVAYFMPMLHIPFRGRANLRNHRKLVIVDSKIAVAGGMNLAWPYIGPPGSQDLWRDLSMVVEGPAVAGAGGAFCVGLAVHHRARPDRAAEPSRDPGRRWHGVERGSSRAQRSGCRRRPAL